MMDDGRLSVFRSPSMNSNGAGPSGFLADPAGPGDERRDRRIARGPSFVFY
jgi:hypothetical protein